MTLWGAAATAVTAQLDAGVALLAVGGLLALGAIGTAVIRIFLARRR